MHDIDVLPPNFNHTAVYAYIISILMGLKYVCVQGLTIQQ